MLCNAMQSQRLVLEVAKASIDEEVKNRRTDFIELQTWAESMRSRLTLP